MTISGHPIDPSTPIGELLHPPTHFVGSPGVVVAHPIDPSTPIGELLHPPTHFVGSPGVVVAHPIDPDAPIGSKLNPPLPPHVVAQSKRVGVFLLFCNDNPRVTTFSRDWAEKALGVTARYFSAQSGWRQSLRTEVFDWYEMPINSTEWLNLSSQGIDSVRPLVEEGTGTTFSSFDHVLIGIDVPGASGGTTPGAYTFLAAQNFSPSLIAHELGHSFGASDAFQETPGGNIRYQDQYCVMGALGWPATYLEPELADPAAPMLNAAGPGMAAPTLMATGWLDEHERNVGADLSATDVFSGGRVETLAALTGAPRPGWTGSPLVIRYFDLLIEYRVNAPDGWDRGLPDPGPLARGQVVVHRSPPEGPMVATFVSSVGAAPGARLTLGPDNPVDIQHPGPLVVGVLSTDAQNNTVRLVLSRRPAQQFAEIGELVNLGRIPTEIDTLIWTRESGLRPVPRKSPLGAVVQQASEVQALHEMAQLATSEETAAITARTSEVLQSLTESISAVPAEAPRTAPASVMDRLTALEAAHAELERTNPGPDLADFITTSKEELSAVRDAVTSALRDS